MIFKCFWDLSKKSNQIKQSYPFRTKAPKNRRTSKTLIKRLLLFSFLAPLCGLLLNTLYHQAGSSGTPLWEKSFYVNSALAFCILIYALFKKRSELYPFLRSNPFKTRRSLCFLPSLAILLAILGSLATGDPFVGQLNPDIHWSLFLIWIPVAEELVFRLGLSGIFGRYLTPMWGSYFSVIIFSWLHSNPGLGQILRGESGLIVGPLLLGVCCEVLKHKSGSILPSMSLHIACNTSAILFLYGDGGWFKPFASLYL